MEDSHPIEKKASLYASRKIRELRESKGLSQPAFGQRIGMKSGTLSAIEVGRRRASLEKLAYIAWVMQVPLSTFILPDNDGTFHNTKDEKTEERVA